MVNTTNKIAGCMLGLIAMMCSTGVQAAVGQPTMAMPPIVPDTVNLELLDEDDVRDTTPKPRRNYATEFNALDYILENRYHNYGDKFTKRWDDHLYLEFGAGVHSDIHKGRGDLSPLTMALLGVGKQFNRYHSLRLKFGLGYGFFEGSRKNFARATANVDWLYSITTYMCGYSPSRLLDVSTVFGGGMRFNYIPHTQNPHSGYDIHGGLQFKFFSGPQGYITLEPYGGVSSRRYDNKFGAFMGLNANFVYYLHNNLSMEERSRYLRTYATDSVRKPQSWRTPWFAQLSSGMAFYHGRGSDTQTAPGHTTAVSVGRWFSSAIGLRASLAHSYATWQKHHSTIGEQQITYNQYSTYTDVQLEALVNPFGFTRNYNWDRPWGMAVAVGAGIGWMRKMQEHDLKTETTFYTGALNLWYKLSDDLHVFIEPRYTNYNYRIPYSNVPNMAHRFSDDVYGVRLGLTAYTRGTSYRQPKDVSEEETSIPLSVGVAGGTSLIYTTGAYSGGKFNYNFNAFAAYHFTKIHAVRLGFEFMSINGYSPQNYRAVSDGVGAAYSGTAMFNHNYKRGFLSLGYLLNVTNFFSGYQGRRFFEAELFFGPSVMFALSSSHTPDASLKLRQGYSMAPRKYNDYDKALFACNGGINLKLNVLRHLAVTLTPQLHVTRFNPRFTGVDMLKIRGIETLDLGVQYDF